MSSAAMDAITTYQAAVVKLMDGIEKEAVRLKARCKPGYELVMVIPEAGEFEVTDGGLDVNKNAYVATIKWLGRFEFVELPGLRRQYEEALVLPAYAD